jgi:hypothetical protein
MLQRIADIFILVCAAGFWCDLRAPMVPPHLLLSGDYIAEPIWQDAFLCEFSVLHWGEFLDIYKQICGDVQDCGGISSLAVIAGTEDGQAALYIFVIACEWPCDAVLADFVRSDEQVEVVAVEKGAQRRPAEAETTAAQVRLESLDFSARIAPNHVGKDSRRGEVPRLVEALELRDFLEFWRNAAVDAEHTIADDGAERELAEDVDDFNEDSPCVLGREFLVKAVEPAEGFALMVAAKHENVIRIFDFEGEEKQQNLSAENAPIDIVAQKQISPRRRIVKPFEDANEVVNVPVNVPNDRNVGRNRQKGRFLFEHSSNRVAKLDDSSFKDRASVPSLAAHPAQQDLENDFVDFGVRQHFSTKS